MPAGKVQDDDLVLGDVALTTKDPDLRRIATVGITRPWLRLTSGLNSRVHAALDAGRLGEAGELREALAWSEAASAPPWLAIVLCLGTGLLLATLLGLALRPGIPFEARLRPAALLVVLAPALPWIRLEIAGWLASTAVLGVSLAAFSSWVIAFAGKGWARFLPPALFTLSATELLVSAQPYSASSVEAMELGIGAFLVGTLCSPLLAASLAVRAHPVGSGEPRASLMVRLRLLSPLWLALLQVLALVVAAVLCKAISKEDGSKPATFPFAAMATIGTWFAWAWWTLWTAVSRRAGTPSLVPQPWARMQDRPAAETP